MQQKLMKQRQQELIDRSRPNTTRPNNKRNEPVLSVQKVDMLDTEFDEEGNEIVSQARQSRQTQENVLSEGPSSARVKTTHRGQPIQDALYNMGQ